jgi:dynein heavy chain
VSDAAKTAKEARAAKAASMDSRHRYIIGCVADLVGIEAAAAEEQVVDSTRFGDFDAFFEAKGQRQLVFYYQPVAVPRAKEPQMKLFVADPEHDDLTHTCIHCVRVTSKAITTSNMANEICFGSFEAGSSGAVLESLDHMVSDVLQPVLRQNENWGKLASGDQQRDQFFDALYRFQSALAEASVAVAHRVELKPFKPAEGQPRLDLSQLKGPAETARLAQEPKTVEQLEALLQEWCQQLEQVIAESEQMRKEADNVGPRAELEHWKSVMARFNGVLDQIKKPECQTVINVLLQAKSRLLNTWKKLDARITEAANEAKDNVKYLYTLDKYCAPLYKCSPVEMMDDIPGLMNAIGMIHSISGYYNTSERMTALCVKITNQMITACKGYIYEKEPRVWDQEREGLVVRLQHVRLFGERDCKRLDIT